MNFQRSVFPMPALSQRTLFVARATRTERLKQRLRLALWWALLAAGGAVPASDALPRYIRDKVAQTTAERAALRAAAAPAP